MSDLSFAVTKLFPASDKQKAVGIHATFNMTMSNADGIIIDVKDMKLMQSKEGKYYIASAYRSYEGKDKDGNPKTINVNYVKFFPEEKNWNKQDAIIRLVLDELKNGSNTNTNANRNTTNTTKPSQPSKPATPAAAKPSRNDSAW